MVITVRNSSCGKVMFLQASVILSTRGRGVGIPEWSIPGGGGGYPEGGGVGVKDQGRLEVYLVRHLLMVPLVTKLPH